MRNVENGREEEARESKLTPPSKMSHLPSVERHFNEFFLLHFTFVAAFVRRTCSHESNDEISLRGVFSKVVRYRISVLIR